MILDIIDNFAAVNAEGVGKLPEKHILCDTEKIRLCEKISVNSKTVIKTRYYLSDFIQPLRFFTVYNGYCNLSRF